MDIRNWSQTAANNASVGAINWAEGMAPAQVNDSARATMADVRGQFDDGGWYTWGQTATFNSTVSFTVTGDQTLIYVPYRRVRAIGTTTGTIYGTITTAVFGALTTVTVVWDNNAVLINETLTIAVSFINRTGIPVPRIDGSLATAVASTATVNLISVAAQTVHITGTTTITSFGPAFPGYCRSIVFDGILTLTYNATSMILPTAANVTTGAGDTAVFMCESGSNWRCLSFIRATGLPVQAAAMGGSARGYIDGLILANNSGAPATAIDIGIGIASANVVPYTPISLTAALTKNFTATFTAGNNQGCLDTGVRTANTTYHIYIIGQAAVSAAADILASTSATAPTMPATWDLRRRIGSVITDASNNIIAFIQIGDAFNLSTSVSVSTAVPSTTTDSLVTVPVPNGVIVTSILSGTGVISSGSWSVLIKDPAVPTAVVTTGNSNVNGGIYLQTYNLNTVRTNTSRQVAVRANAVMAGFTMNAHGWIDQRGQNA
jgi:hypothetical protein